MRKIVMKSCLINLTGKGRTDWKSFKNVRNRVRPKDCQLYQRLLAKRYLQTLIVGCGGRFWATVLVTLVDFGLMMSHLNWTKVDTAGVNNLFQLFIRKWQINLKWPENISWSLNILFCCARELYFLMGVVLATIDRVLVFSVWIRQSYSLRSLW